VKNKSISVFRIFAFNFLCFLQGKVDPTHAWSAHHPTQFSPPVGGDYLCRSVYHTERFLFLFFLYNTIEGGSVAEWLACWTQAQKARIQIAVATLSDNSLRQTDHTHCASVHQAAKLVAALLRFAGVTAGLVESRPNNRLPPGL